MNKFSKPLNLINFWAVLLFCFFVAGNSVVFGQLKLARLFSDHVVLQRQKTIPVWGWANANETVNVSLANQTKTAKANDNGKWSVDFAPMEAGGPFALKVSDGSNNLTVNDVLIGEVWLCSGQSNMEWTVKQADNFKEEKKDAELSKHSTFLRSAQCRNQSAK